MEKNNNLSVAFVINVDWYFRLHWINRAKALKAQGYKIYVITRFTDAKHKQYFEENGFICFDWHVSRAGLGIVSEFKSYLELKRLITDIAPSCIHAITIKPNIYASYVAKSLSIPCIKSVTGLGVVFSHSSLKYRLIKNIISCLYRHSSRNTRGAFIFENKQDQKLFHSLNIGKGQRSVHIAGAGVDVEYFSSSRKVLSDPTITVLFAARLLKDKGLDMLIRAVEQARSKGVNLSLQVAGILDPESEGGYSLDEIHSLAATHQFIWLGQVDDKDMPNVFSSVDVVALPTRYGEGIPRVLIEAGAAERIVVTSNIGGCKEFIQEQVDGVLFDPYDFEGMADCFVDMQVNTFKYQAIATKLRDKVVTYYSDDTIISQFINVYRCISCDHIQR